MTGSKWSTLRDEYGKAQADVLWVNGWQRAIILRDRSFRHIGICTFGFNLSEHMDTSIKRLRTIVSTRALEDLAL